MKRHEDDVILKLLYRRPKLSVGDLAFCAGWLSRNKHQPLKSKAHRTLMRLEERGLAQRQDGKWSLTPAGKARCEAELNPAHVP